MATAVEAVLAGVERAEAECLRTISVAKELELELDVGNLTATDTNAPDVRRFRREPEEFLRALARDNTQLLVNAVWEVPTERVQEVIVAKLPPGTTRIPREKAVPKPRPPTRWEQFARLKGIRKKKKTNLVWDSEKKEWRRRWGYKRANDDTKDWVIEVPETADPNEDMFAKRAAAKKERVAKNELNRLRNIARSQKTKAPAIGIAPSSQPSKSELSKAIHVAKTSTASVGKFQDKLPKEKEMRNTGKKRKFQPLIGDFSAEKQNQLELLKIMASKKPKLDLTKAVNKQLREDEQEEAAKRKKMGSKGRKGHKNYNRKDGKGQYRKSASKRGRGK
ncbi:ribosome biogenesis regulatory protein homolog [Pristis pectinata]|uniref:ribosome biogenesis regulatory protein homolog n=1 Tax=Pristis pectinata TaxID=685728 RepID=UPI00223D15E5|nr:ribosome biogenesis regulatory protein homolog [Pristis pectinata]